MSEDLEAQQSVAQSLWPPEQNVLHSDHLPFDFLSKNVGFIRCIWTKGKEFVKHMELVALYFFC